MRSIHIIALAAAVACSAASFTAAQLTAAPSAAAHLRVAVVQFRSGTNLSDNVERMRHHIAGAASEGAEVVVFPECAVSSYFAEAVLELSETALLAAEEALLAACAEHRIGAVIGIPHFVDGNIHNCALIVSPEGKIVARHYKVHLVGGDTKWNCAAGSEPSPVFKIGDTSCSVVICHDSRYPELTRLPVLAGARVVFYISHESSVAQESKLVPYRAQVQARAVENGVFLVHANAPADGARKGSHGQSRIVNPDGNVISEASIFEEEILFADLELAKATAENALRSLDGWPLSKWWRDGVGHVRVID